MLKVVYLALIGVAMSAASVAIISFLFGVGMGKILGIRPAYMISLSLISISRLVIQGLRFHMIANRLVGRVRFREAVIVRIASEFIALTTVAYIGGEFVRIAWLRLRGARIGRAVMVAYLEAINDVYIGGSLSLASGISVLSRASPYLIIPILGTSLVSISLYTILLLLAWRGIERIGLGALRPIIGEGVSRLEGRLTDMVSDLRSSIEGLLGRDGIRIWLPAITLTMLIALLHGAVLFVSLEAFGEGIGLLESVMAVYASLAISSLPITLGGSGLSELSAYHYINAIGRAGWGAVLLWRLSSYHLPLLVSGISLAYLAGRGAITLSRSSV